MSDPGQQASQPQGGTKTAEDPDLQKIARWVAEIELYDRETSNWRRRAKNIVRRYKDDRGANDTDLRVGARFNAFWANIQTQMPSLYSRNPKPDIQRRFKDADPVGRVASDVLERVVSVFCDNDPFYATMRRTVKDYKLVGRGTTWERYIPTVQPMELTDSVGDGNLTDVPEQVTYEESITDYVHMQDFGHNICRTPDEIWCIWRIVYLERNALIDRLMQSKRFAGRDRATVSLFVTEHVPMDYVQKDISGEKLSDGVAKASIYELWDKQRKVAVWLHKSVPEALDLRPDPLKLDGFFPAPVPLLANLANDSCIPTPDYIESQDQYIELDDLTTRISALTKAVKAAGVYDASAEGLNRLLNEGVENKLIPVENFAIMAEKGGLAGAIFMLPLKDIVDALIALYKARDKVKEDLHEISGIPDIARGQSDANETLGAQEIKTSFAINRISDDQRDIQRFVKEIIRIKVDIICGHFQMETIKKISGVRLFTQAEKQQVGQFQQAMQAAQQAQQKPPQPGMPPSPQMPPPQPPPVLSGLTQENIEQMMSDPTWEEVEALIRDDAMRCFRIDIETDSTIKADEEQDKASRIEYVKAIGEYMASALPAGQQHPELVPFLLEGLQFLSRAFPVGKNMESALNNAIAKLEKVAANPPPKQDPEMAKVQGQMQIEQAKLQGSMQIKQAEIQANAQAEATKAQAQAAVQQHLNQLEDQRRIHELQGEQELERFKASNDMQIKQAEIEQAERLAVMENDRELAKARIQQETAIMVARISANATDGAEEEKMAVSEDKALEEALAVSEPEEEDEDMKNTREISAKLDALIAHLAQPQPDVAGAINNLAQAHAKTHEGISNLHKAVTSEKEIVRDPKTNKPTGVRIKPDPKELANQLRN